MLIRFLFSVNYETIFIKLGFQLLLDVNKTGKKKYLQIRREQANKSVQAWASRRWWKLAK